MILDSTGNHLDSALKIVVFAGSSYHNEDELKKRIKRKEPPLANKCFKKVHGKLVVEPTLESLVELRANNIYVVAKDSNLEMLSNYPVTGIPEKKGNTFADNIMLFLKKVNLDKNEPVYMVFGDHLFADAVSRLHFLRRADSMYKWDKENIAAITSVALADTFLAFIPYVQRDFIHSSEFSFRGAADWIVNPSNINMNNINHLYNVRKQEESHVIVDSIRKLLKHVGKEAYRAIWDLSFLNLTKHLNKKYLKFGGSNTLWIRYRTKRIPISRIERHGGTLVQKKGEPRPIVHFVPNPYAYCGIDIDYQYELDMFASHYDTIKDKIVQVKEELNNGTSPIGIFSDKKFLLKYYL